MAESIKFIFNTVIRFFVPIVTIIILFYARASIGNSKIPQEKSAKSSGFWAGVLLFIMALIYEVSKLLKSGFTNDPLYQGFNLGLALFSAIVTFGLFISGKRFAHPHFSSFGILATVFISLYVLFSYVFIRTYNELILSLTLGVTFGILAHYAMPSRKPTSGHATGGHGGPGHH